MYPKPHGTFLYISLLAALRKNFGSHKSFECPDHPSSPSNCSSAVAMAAEAKPMKLGTRVEVIGKGIVGKVTYMGTTLFSSGEYTHIIISDP